LKYAHVQANLLLAPATSTYPGPMSESGERAGPREHAAVASVLLIEDEPGIVDFVRRGLEGDGFRVETELDGVRGEQRSRRELCRRRPDRAGAARLRRLDAPAGKAGARGEHDLSTSRGLSLSSAMLLYDSAVSGNCYKVRLLLGMLGIAFERREVDVVDRSGRLELLGELNPGLRVPTLVLDDGEPLAESNAILCYLAEGSEWLPTERLARARVLQWLFFEQYSHEPYIAVVRFWVCFAAERPPEAEIAARRRGGYAALDAMERHLARREFLVAERFTIADIALYAYTHVAHEAGFQMTGYPHVAAWLARVAAQPGHVPITA